MPAKRERIETSPFSEAPAPSTRESCVTIELEAVEVSCLESLSSPPSEIGGYFELDLPDYGANSSFPDGFCYQSARAAIRAALSCTTFTRVLAPAYVCDSVIQAGRDAGLTVETYELDETLYPKNLPDSLASDCAVLYVNYFGICQHHARKIVERAPPAVTIIDNSHALFAPPVAGALATVYSPRKFAGLPDGGLLTASPQLEITPPAEEDQGSFDRMQFLLRRMAYSAREGYAEFDEARRSLADTTPLAMSRLTRRLMRSIRWSEVSKRRRENYAILAAMLDGANDYPRALMADDVPLVYLFTLRGRPADPIRSELAARDIFTATYWKAALPRAQAGSIEEVLINETLFLPIDQRMSRAEVEKVGKQVLQLIGLDG